MEDEDQPALATAEGPTPPPPQLLWKKAPTAPRPTEAQQETRECDGPEGGEPLST